MIKDPQGLYSFILNLLKQSSKIANDLYQANDSFKIKSDLSPVTYADKKIEEFIITKIKEAYPQDSIICEEHDDINNNKNATWTIDPIDGTKAFITGIPTWSSIISYQVNSEFILSALTFPALNQIFISIKDFGFFLNDKEIKESDIQSLADKQIKNSNRNFILATGSTDHFGASYDKFQSIREKSSFTIYGCDAYLYCLLAIGKIDLIIDCSLKVYDYAPMITMMRSSQCIITDWQGKDLTLTSDGQIIAARNKELHNFAQNILN